MPPLPDDRERGQRSNVSTSLHAGHANSSTAVIPTGSGAVGSEAGLVVPGVGLNTNSGGDEADDYSAVGSDSGLGDLTGGMETTMDYLPNFTPLERIAITVCIGNRQPISSDSRGRIASVGSY